MLFIPAAETTKKAVRTDNASFVAANNAAAQAQLAQQQQQQAAAQAAAQAQAQAEMAKRRSRKPTDKNMPEGVESCIPDGELVAHYNQLRDYERRLDATIARKRLDALDNVNRYPKVGLYTTR